MKIVLAFDSYKGCLSAADACQAAIEGVRSVYPDAETLSLPLSDGGEGLVECVAAVLPVRLVRFAAHGPLMEPIEAVYALSDDGHTAYMEMAATSGLPMVPCELRNPLRTTTYGVGEMIMDAARRGCRTIVIGLGGSATCDGGRGMLQALQDAGADLQALPRLLIASDVTNPLYGLNGAAYVFAPQKGATPEQVVLLDEQLRKQAREAADAGIAPLELADHPGAGAAGGLGYGLMAYIGAEMCSGIDLVLDMLNFDSRIADADYVITGEGRSDFQTLMGKVPDGVLRRCRKQAVPTWLLSGVIDDQDGALAAAFDRLGSINAGDKRPLDVLLRPETARENMTRAVREALINWSDRPC